MWERVVGQERAVQVLQRAGERPVHAYLLVGPPGSGVEDAARGLAAVLIGTAAEADDPDGATQRRVFRGVHPDVVEFEPEGTFFLTGQAAEVIDEVSRSPIEGERKVVVLLDVERMKDEAANRLLKTIEEPPPRAVLVLTTSRPEDVLATIRSRCQRVDLDPLRDEVLVATLVEQGVDRDAAARAAALSGGFLARARALAGPLAALRLAFAAVPARVDGSGAAAATLAAELDAAVDAAAAHVSEGQAAELAEFDADMERRGYSDRDARRLRRRLEKRHDRETRRTRTDLLLEGVTAIETVYRDALAAPAAPLNSDLPPLSLLPRSCADALDACRTAREAFVINEKGLLHLAHLLLRLPPSGSGQGSAR